MSRVALPALAVAIVLAGCGGGGGLSASDYRQKANAACRDAEQRINAVKAPTSATGPALSSYLQSVVDVAEKPVKEIEKLDPPSDLKKDHHEYVRTTKQGIEKLRALADQLKNSKNPTDLRAAAQAAQRDIQGLSKRSEQEAKKLGLTACAN